MVVLREISYRPWELRLHNKSEFNALEKIIHLDEDTRLMMKAAGGDARSFARLYRKYLPAVTAYSTSINGHNGSAEDVAQEVFARVWQKRSQYRPESSMKTYLFSFARIIVRERQFNSQNVSYGLGKNADLQSVSAGQEYQAENELVELEDQVRKAIDHLSVKQQLAVKLCYFDNLSIQEAAERVKDSYCTFQKRLYRAQKILMARLARFVK
jgi:RNA polymerase sigma-70 factor, ECF subfamily